jgi:hypothetical protein
LSPHAKVFGPEGAGGCVFVATGDGGGDEDADAGWVAAALRAAAVGAGLGIAVALSVAVAVAVTVAVAIAVADADGAVLGASVDAGFEQPPTIINTAAAQPIFRLRPIAAPLI